MSNPKVSIVVPCYNASRYLNETVSSIKNSHFDDYEVHFVNDGSTDSTGEILESAARGYPNFFVHHTENNGEGAAFSYGAKISTGKYVIRLDSDDLMLEDRIARQFNWMEVHPHVDAAGAWATYFGEDLYFNRTIKTPVSSNFLTLILNFYNPVINPTVIVKRSVFDSVQPGGYKIGADLDFWLKIVLKGGVLDNMPFTVLKYRRHPGQATSAGKSVQISAAIEEIYTSNFCRGNTADNLTKYYELGRLWRKNELDVSFLKPILMSQEFRYEDDFSLRCNQIQSLLTLIFRCNSNLKEKVQFIIDYARFSGHSAELLLAFFAKLLRGVTVR